MQAKENYLMRINEHGIDQREDKLKTDEQFRSESYTFISKDARFQEKRV